MSWSVQIIGKPEKVAAELDAESAKLTEQSKIEYDEALPHLKAMVLQNVGQDYLVEINANGHATFVNGKRTYGSVNVTLKPFYSKLAL
jgi:hypothetical protein